VMSDPDVLAAMGKIHFLRELKGNGKATDATDADVEQIVTALRQTVVNAGHPPELLVRYTKALDRLTAGDDSINPFVTKSNLSKIVGSQVDHDSVRINPDTGKVEASFQLDPNAHILRDLMTTAGSDAASGDKLAISGLKKVLDDFNKVNGVKQSLNPDDLRKLAAGEAVTIETEQGTFHFKPMETDSQLEDIGNSLQRDLDTVKLSQEIENLPAPHETLSDAQSDSLMQAATGVMDAFQPNMRFTDANGDVHDVRAQMSEAIEKLGFRQMGRPLTGADFGPLQDLLNQVYLTSHRDGPVMRDEAASDSARRPGDDDDGVVSGEARADIDRSEFHGNHEVQDDVVMQAKVVEALPNLIPGLPTDFDGSQPLSLRIQGPGTETARAVPVQVTLVEPGSDGKTPAARYVLEDGVYVIQVSKGARPQDVERALAHEIAEINHR
ncbi:MAG: hypothetical protein HN348_33870, partial [Proteobacteria bacterium]|nr:hypothetical protein [Pseudomonadota bacterium]